MRVLTYPYSDAYTPSMPVVDLGVSQPGARQPAQVVTAVVDSGADGTLVPIDVLEAVSAGYVGEAFIRGISGKRQGVSMYLATLHIGSHVLNAVRVVAVHEGSEAILGRNVLQFLVVTLNGPAAATEVVV